MKVFESPSFTFNWRDLAGWQADGIQFSTSSNEAVKMYDALLHQAIYHYNDGQLGGFSGRPICFGMQRNVLSYLC